MNDEAEIRLANLKALNLGPKDLVSRVGKTSSYWSDLLRGNKSFGEKTARNIEECLGLPRDWLDKDHEGVAAPALASAPTPAITLPRALYVVADAIATDNDFYRRHWPKVNKWLNEIGSEPELLDDFPKRLEPLRLSKSDSVQGRDNDGTGSAFADDLKLNPRTRADAQRIPAKKKGRSH